MPRLAAKCSAVAPIGGPTMPSISCGLMPASLRALTEASSIRRSSVLPDPRENVLSPTPTIQDWSLSEYIGLLLQILRLSARDPSHNAATRRLARYRLRPFGEHGLASSAYPVHGRARP